MRAQAQAHTPARKPTPAKTKTKAPAPVKIIEIHPAEQAGMAVHQAIEDGVSVVTGAVGSGISYAFGFVKGLIKGH